MLVRLHQELSSIGFKGLALVDLPLGSHPFYLGLTLQIFQEGSQTCIIYVRKLRVFLVGTKYLEILEPSLSDLKAVHLSGHCQCYTIDSQHYMFLHSDLSSFLIVD